MLKTEEQKKKARQYIKEWRLKNKDKVKLQRKRHNILHREEIRDYNKKWKLKNLDKVKLSSKKDQLRRTKKLKLMVLSYYSNGLLTCKQCGFSDIRALSIDHINGGGAIHRKTMKGTSFYSYLIKENYPEGYQVLCMNCQFIKAFDYKAKKN